MAITTVTLGGNEAEAPRSIGKKAFRLSNYILVAASSSCIFLILSLRLIPSFAGFLLILVHIVTILAAISGCAAWYGTHMAGTVVSAVLQGALALLFFTRTDDVLHWVNSYVREKEGAEIVKMAGTLGLMIFALDWMLLTLAFFIKFYPSVSSSNRVGSSSKEEDLKDWPWPFQV